MITLYNLSLLISVKYIECSITFLNIALKFLALSVKWELGISFTMLKSSTFHSTRSSRVLALFGKRLLQVTITLKYTYTVDIQIQIITTYKNPTCKFLRPTNCEEALWDFLSASPSQDTWAPSVPVSETQPALGRQHHLVARTENWPNQLFPPNFFLKRILLPQPIHLSFLWASPLS